MKLREREVYYTSEPYYDLFNGGYIKPEEFLVNESDVDRIYNAIAVIEQFFEQAQEAGVMEFT